MSSYTDDDLADALGKAYAGELASMRAYQLLSRDVGWTTAGHIEEDIRLDAQDEFNHSQQYADMLETMGHDVSEHAEQHNYDAIVPNDHTDVESALAGVWYLENEGMQLDQDIIDITQETGYHDFANTVGTILGDERAHRNEVEDYLEDAFGWDDDDFDALASLDDFAAYEPDQTVDASLDDVSE